MSDLRRLKESACAAVEAHREELIRISSAIHGQPEVAFHEFKSAALLGDTLAAHGFAVRRGVGELETAFRAEAQRNGAVPTIAFVAEYDALPEIGHACGHNIIGTAAVAAGIGMQAVLGQLPGRVVVIGAPAEESGGGKIILLECGAFADVDAAMMVHPSSYTMVSRGSLASMRLTVEFTGKAAHAAAAPEDGINALEAVILAFNNVNALRLHLKGDARVHGIITRGGTAVNIIPDKAEAVFSVRAATQSYADEVLRRVIQCAEAAALATGAQLKPTVRPGYAAMLPNNVLARLFAENWRSIGVEVREPRNGGGMGSTDFGNVSQALPGIHPYIAIATEDVAGHTIGFREASLSPAGHEGLMNAAKALAMTTIDLLARPDMLQASQQEFRAAREAAVGRR
jgi:amidohydrolase